MPTWEQLLIRTADIDCPRLLSYWRWLLQKDYHPIVMTAFGDWFLLDDDGSVHFLDLVAGKLSKAADTGEEFKQVMGRPEKLDEWFMADLVQHCSMDSGSSSAQDSAMATRFRPCWEGRLRSPTLSRPISQFTRASSARFTNRRGICQREPRSTNSWLTAKNRRRVAT